MTVAIVHAAETDRLLLELDRMSRHIGTRSQRIRIAVTPREFELIRARFLQDYGAFHKRFRFHLLVVDEHASDPLLEAEFVPGYEPPSEGAA